MLFAPDEDHKAIHEVARDCARDKLVPNARHRAKANISLQRIGLPK